MGKAKRQRKKETEDLKAWFNEFAVACPWRAKPDGEQPFCISTLKGNKAMVCIPTNCAPLFIANRLLQMTLGPMVYGSKTTH